MRGANVRRACRTKNFLAEESRVFTGARPIPFRVLYTTHSRRTPRAGAGGRWVAKPGRTEELKRVRSLFPVGTETTLERLVARRPNLSWIHANFDPRNCHRSDALARNRALTSVVVGNKFFVIALEASTRGNCVFNPFRTDCESSRMKET